MRASLRERARPSPPSHVAACGQGICLDEVLEQFGLLLRSQSDAGVRDRKLDPVAAVPCTQAAWNRLLNELRCGGFDSNRRRAWLPAL
jgi:hypothetical protein